MSKTTLPIADSLRLNCGVVLQNRIVKSAMSEALADGFNNPSDAHINLFSLWAASGAGLLIVGNTSVARGHLEHAANFVLDEATDMDKVRRLAAAGKRHGAKVLCQLAHAGRQTPQAINPQPLSVSDLRLDLDGYGKPRMADEAELDAVVTQFAHAASLAQDAGFDGVEIHSAHGYLLSSALSPKINTRTDRFGGSLENRARLVINVIRAVRDAVGEKFIVAVKLNSSDFQKGGFSHEDSIGTAKLLQHEGIDFLEISGGNFETPVAYQHASKQTDDNKINKPREAYFLTYARDIKAAINIPLMVTGGFRSSQVMNDAIDHNETDLIGIGRPFIMDATFAAKLLSGKIDLAPAMEREFPPAESLPRGAVLNWFCHQLTVLAKQGAADLSVSVTDGHQRYLHDIESATELLTQTRDDKMHYTSR